MKLNYERIFHNIRQNTDEWEALRVGKVTASHFKDIMAYHEKGKWGKEAEKYARKKALEIVTKKIDKRSGFYGKFMKDGHILEPEARKEYHETTFNNVYNGGFFEFGPFGCSPDGLVNEDGLLQIKSVIQETIWAANMAIEEDGGVSFVKPHKWQLVGEMIGAGRKWIDLVYYCPEFPEEKRITMKRFHLKESDFILLMNRLESFMKLIHSYITKLK